MTHKRRDVTSATGTASSSVADGGDSSLERIPENILHEIFSKLEPETLSTLCSLACVSRTLNSSVKQPLSSLSSIDLSAFSLDSCSFGGIVRRMGNIKSITLDCLRLNVSSIRSFIGPDVEELILLKCSSLSYRLLAFIGQSCPNLRVLRLEFSGFIDKSAIFDSHLKHLLTCCGYLESLRVKVRGGEINGSGFMMLGIYHLLPENLKVLKLQPASAVDTISFLRKFSYTNMGLPITPISFRQSLTHISLVIDVITDVLILTIVHALPLLTELDLKDRPRSDPSPDDLSDLGIHSLIRCRHLTSLSLIRSRQHIPTSFKRVTDMGMFLLSEGCRGLESVRLGGFSKVSDAGFTSVFNSCLNLKKFEIQNAFLLTDLAFQDASKVHRPLVEVKLTSCSYITSEAVHELATSSMLEVLDLFGCRSVADSCLSTVSRLVFLTSLNLGGADVTDAGMAVLGKGNTPISCLSLRGCKRVTDKGITFLLKSEGKIVKNLSSLDLGHMPGITDNAILTIANASLGLTELCIRNCFHVTDESVKALALKGRNEDEGKGLCSLDLENCNGLSVECFKFLKKPFFHGLRWIGIGRTGLIGVGDGGVGEIHRERPWMNVCTEGCEMGCHDGWQFHKFRC